MAEEQAQRKTIEMLIEEAIVLLNTVKIMLTDPEGKPISDAYYAVDMGISALELMPEILCMMDHMEIFLNKIENRMEE